MRRFWIREAADPYLYLRTTLDGRVIVGGEDEEFSDEKRRDALVPSKIAAIRRMVGLPAIGAIPGAPLGLPDPDAELFALET